MLSSAVPRNALFSVREQAFYICDLTKKKKSWGESSILFLHLAQIFMRGLLTTERQKEPTIFLFTSAKVVCTVSSTHRGVTIEQRASELVLYGQDRNAMPVRITNRTLLSENQRHRDLLILAEIHSPAKWYKE